MNNLIKRRQRIVRLRDTEYKQAAAKLAQAEQVKQKLDSMNARISTLRVSFVQGAGMSNGQEMAATYETSDRLDVARERLKTTIIKACVKTQVFKQIADASHRKAFGANQLHDRAVAIIEREAEDRALRNIVFRSNVTIGKARS